MRWPVFLIFAFIALVLDASVVPLLTLPRLGSIAPNIPLTLIVFVCLFASRLSALGAALLLGVLVDLTLPPPGSNTYIIGPHALGFVVGAYLVLQLRTMVFRQRALTVGVLTTVAALVAGIVAVAIYVIRSWYGEPITYPTQNPSASMELVRQIGIAIYSGLIAIPVGWVLLGTLPLWNFHWGHPRRSTNVR